MIFFSISTSGFSNGKVTGLGFSFSGLKCERWVSTPPLTLGSGSSGQGYSCFFTFLSLATTARFLLMPNRTFPRALRGTPLTPLLELRKRSEAELVPVNANEEWDIEAILQTSPNYTLASPIRSLILKYSSRTCESGKKLPIRLSEQFSKLSF